MSKNLAAREQTPSAGIVGTVVSFQGSWGSGLATLVLRSDDGQVHSIPCDSGATVRALAAAFGDGVIGAHPNNVPALRGRRIRAFNDEMGMMLAGSILPSRFSHGGHDERQKLSQSKTHQVSGTAPRSVSESCAIRSRKLTRCYRRTSAGRSRQSARSLVTWSPLLIAVSTNSHQLSRRKCCR